jgi:hypothetical protein
VVELYHTFKEELTAMPLKLFHEIEREETPSNSFYEADIILIPTLDKDTIKKEKYYFFMNIDIKTLNKILENSIQQQIKMIIHHNQVGEITQTEKVKYPMFLLTCRI